MSKLDLNQIVKTEIHVHLEGSIEPETLQKLAIKNHVALPVDNIESLRQYFKFRDFAHFVDVYKLVCSCLCDPEDFETITYEFGSYMFRQRIKYAEVTFTPYLHVSKDLPFDILMDGLSHGRARAEEEFGVKIVWVFDIPRHFPESSWPTLEYALASKNRGVVAFGLGGDEANFPPELFVSAFEQAQEGGLHLVPHAGETRGPESIWSAIRKLGAERIGHGVRCIEDPVLVDYLVENRIPLEISPTSNIRLAVYNNYDEHPLRKLYDTGVLITINSDDPALFGTSLSQEYGILQSVFGFSNEEMLEVSLNSVHVSFLSEGEKEKLKKDIIGSFPAKNSNHSYIGVLP